MGPALCAGPFLRAGKGQVSQAKRRKREVLRKSAGEWGEKTCIWVDILISELFDPKLLCISLISTEIGLFSMILPSVFSQILSIYKIWEIYSCFLGYKCLKRVILRKSGAKTWKNMEKHAYVICSGDLFWVKLSPNMFFEKIATGKLLSKNEPQRF